MYTEIRCLDCLELIDAEHLDLDKKWADCQACGNSFGFEHKWDSKLRNKRETFQPEGFDVVKTESLLEVSFHPLTNLPDIPAIGFLSKLISYVNKAFGILVLAFLLFFIYGYTKQELPAMRGTLSWLNLIVILLITSFIIVVIFRTLILNKTPRHKLSLTKKQLKTKRIQSLQENDTKTKPVIIKIASQEIKQCYVRTFEKSPVGFELVVVKKNDEKQVAFGPMFNLHHALYLEQEIEQFLNIKDVKQIGEYEV